MAWLGLDFGTSSAKALLVAPDGAVLARAHEPYPLMSGVGGLSEQDPNDYLRAAQALLTAVSDGGKIDGIGLTGQNPTQVFIARDGKPVRPAITWQDTRAAREAAELAERLGDPVALVGTSLAWAPTNVPAKLLWLARHEAVTIKRTWLILQPKDYVGFALTSVPSADAWASKGLCDVRSEAPAQAILDAVGWPLGVVPHIAAPWSLRGRVTSQAAHAFGLVKGTPVSVGWSDALAPMLGVGAFREPCGIVVTGTSDVGGVIAARVPQDGGALYSVPGNCAPLPLVYGPTQTSGAAVGWFAKIVNVDPARVSALAAEARPQSKGEVPPIFIPYLAGERAPVWRADARGAFLGLSLAHDEAALARAVLTGVACTTRHLLEEAVQVVGWRPDKIHLGGLAAADPTSRAIRAGVLGSPILFHTEPHSSTLGAAMLGAAAAGVDLRDTFELAGLPRYYEPPIAEIEAGQAAYERFRGAVDLLLA